MRDYTIEPTFEFIEETKRLKTFLFKRQSLTPAGCGELEDDGLAPLVALEDIRNGLCRWPTTMEHSCGRESGTKVYCPFHTARARWKQC